MELGYQNRRRYILKYDTRVVKEIPGSVKNQGNRGRSPPYIEGNPSTAFAAQLIPQYESHIRVTKETIQFVVNLTKEIPHSNRVTKGRTPSFILTGISSGDRETCRPG